MSNSVYPVLPGIQFNVSRTPIFKTDVKTTPSGREYRAAQMIAPLYRYSLTYEFLRDTAAFQEFRTLFGFYNQRQGSFDSFLFSDPDDSSAITQAVGVGDGSTKIFQLVRTLGGSVEPVYDLNSAIGIYLNGVSQSLGGNYTVNSTGGVTFINAPGAGVAITWTGNYYWRCRFLQDEMSFEKFMQALWEAKKVEFITVKP